MQVRTAEIARERLLTDYDRVLRIEGHYAGMLRIGVWLASLLAYWAWSGNWVWGANATPAMRYIVLGYALSSLIWWVALGIVLPRRRVAEAPLRKLYASLLIAHLLDHLYVAIVVYLTGGFGSHAYVLFALLAVKAAVCYPYLHQLAQISFLSGIIWVVVCYLREQSLFFLLDQVFLMRYATLALLTLGAVSLGHLLERRQQAIDLLGRTLHQNSRALEDQTHLVQGTANELATRLVEMRSLQESVKAINSSLALDELLQLIVENATQVLRGARCTIALVDPERKHVLTAAAAGIRRRDLWGTSFALGRGAAGWVVENRRPVLIHDVGQDPRFVKLGDWPIASLMSVPLISDGLVIGAVTATSPAQQAFSDADVNLLDAFADQAAIAVRNASLYQQLAQEEKQTTRLYQSVLEKSNELEAILRGIGDAVIVVDPDLKLLMMNTVATRIFHVYRMPEPNTRLPEIVDHEELLSLARDTLGDEELPKIREIALAGEGDRVLTYQALASTVQGADEQARGVVIVMRDITSQKEIDEIKSNFLSVVSHELRTPLHSIKGFVDIILMGKTGEINELQRDFLQTVKESTTNLQRLIDDLLEFSRMEAGKIKLEPEPLSIYDVTARVVERLSPLAQEAELSLVNSVGPEIALVEADTMRIEQVLTNLVSNAIKFTPEHGEVTVMAQDQGEYVRVSVRDEGIGIPEEEQGNIFQRFYQVDSSATRSYRGAGLGLTICKFIVEYHRGKIWVESQVGQGSTFHFLLPKELPEDEDLVIDFTTPVRRLRE